MINETTAGYVEGADTEGRRFSGLTLHARPTLQQID